MDLNDIISMIGIFLAFVILAAGCCIYRLTGAHWTWVLAIGLFFIFVNRAMLLFGPGHTISARLITEAALACLAGALWLFYRDLRHIYRQVRREEERRRKRK